MQGDQSANSWIHLHVGILSRVRSLLQIFGVQKNTKSTTILKYILILKWSVTEVPTLQGFKPLSHGLQSNDNLNKCSLNFITRDQKWQVWQDSYHNLHPCAQHCCLSLSLMVLWGPTGATEISCHPRHAPLPSIPLEIPAVVVSIKDCCQLATVETSAMSRPGGKWK